MTNNKQSMKLYTEEELRKHLYNHDESFFEKLTPIELPSDEGIKKIMELDDMEFDEFDPYHVSHLDGAKWMRDKIQGVTMSNDKQSIVEWFFNQLVANRIIVMNGTTYWDKVKTKYEILLEQAKQIEAERMQEQYQDGREIGKIEILTTQSTSNASAYSEGYNKGFLAALEYMNSTIENKIKLRKYEK